MPPAMPITTVRKTGRVLAARMFMTLCSVDDKSDLYKTEQRRRGLVMPIRPVSSKLTHATIVS